MASSAHQYALPTARSRWPAIYREAFEERAAIMEHDGWIPRSEAERLAEADVRAACDREARRTMGGK